MSYTPEVFYDTTARPGDSPPGIAGIAFSQDTKGVLHAYDINLEDDIFSYSVDAAFARSTIETNIIPSFNSGRGDLAALLKLKPIPVPALLPLGIATLALGLAGSIGVAVKRRR